MGYNENTEKYIKRLATMVSNEVNDSRIIEAFQQVHRHKFLESGFYIIDHNNKHKFINRENTSVEEVLDHIYDSKHLLIKLFNTGKPSSSSEPVLMAKMLDMLDIQSGMRVLEIGTGTGYNAALISYLVGQSGTVVTIDNQAELTKRAQLIFEEEALSRITVVCGDGKYGVPKFAKYDRIISTAACSNISSEWIDQLADGGKIILPFTRGSSLAVLEKLGNKLIGNFADIEVAFMPLIEQTNSYETKLNNYDVRSLTTSSFRFFVNVFMPRVIVYASRSETDTLANIQFRSDSTRNAQIATVENDKGDLKIVCTDDVFMNKIIEIIVQWNKCSEPKRSQYSIEVSGDSVMEVKLKCNNIIIPIKWDN